MAQTNYTDVSSTAPYSYSDAPEVVPPPPDLEYAGHHPPASESYGSSPDPKLPEPVNAHTIPVARRWWQRKRFWIILAIVVLAVIALVVGLVVGLVVNKDSPDSSQEEGQPKTDDDDGDVDPASICDGALCPQVISTAAFEDELHIFIRTSDNHISHKSGDGSSFGGPWEDLGTTTRTFVSQPAAVAWSPDDGDRLDVFALSSGSTIYSRHLQNDSWSKWEKIVTAADSQPVLCKVVDDRIDLWAADVDEHEIGHTFWVPDEDNFTSVGQDDYQFFDGVADVGPIASAPALICGEGRIQHDEAWYDRDTKALWHRYYITDRTWTNPNTFGGNFLGDPALFWTSNDSERVDFFGVQEDHEVYHFSRTDEDYSELESLGGNVTSTPSVVSPSKGVYDVVALGRDSKVKHIHYDGKAWDKEWEDLGVKASSAPQVTMFDGKIVLMVLEKDGVSYASWKSGGESSWAKLVEIQSMGGDPSLEFFTEQE